VVPGFSYARGVLTFDEGRFMLAFEDVSLTSRSFGFFYD